MKNKIVFLCFIFINLDNCLAQKFSLGIQSGFEDTFRDKKIDRHANYAVFLQAPLSSSWSLRVNAEFFRKKHYGSRWESEYRGTTYTVRDAQLWRSHSLNLAISKRIVGTTYLGTGVSANLIKFKRIVHDSFWPILFTWDDKVLPNEIENRDLYLLRFGLLSMLGWEKAILGKINFVVETRYALIFVSSDLGYGPWNTLESISIWGGLKFGF